MSYGALLIKYESKTKVEYINKFVLYDEKECCVSSLFHPNVQDLFLLVCAERAP